MCRLLNANELPRGQSSAGDSSPAIIIRIFVNCSQLIKFLYTWKHILLAPVESIIVKNIGLAHRVCIGVTMVDSRSARTLSHCNTFISCTRTPSPIDLPRYPLIAWDSSFSDLPFPLFEAHYKLFSL